MNFMKMLSENTMKTFNTLSENTMKTFNTLSKHFLLFVSEQKGNKILRWKGP